MIFHLCREPISHKTEGFPMAYYAVDRTHPRYLMMHHWHTEPEFLLVREGRMVLTLDGRELVLRQGQFTLIPSGTVHSGVPEEARYECVVFDSTVLTAILQGSTKERALAELSQNRTGDVPQPLYRLTDCLRNKEPGYQAEALSALFSLLCDWIRNPWPSVGSSLSRAHKSRLIPFENAVLYLEEHYRDRVSLQALSDAAGLSEKYFGEYFKNVTGKTPFQYLNEYRTERAAELLSRTNESVTEVSLACGFNDLSYFVKTFRKHYGVSPGSYRKGKK